MLCHALKTNNNFNNKIILCLFLIFLFLNPFRGVHCVPKCCSLVINNYWKWYFSTHIRLMFLNISQESVTVVAGGNSSTSANYPPGKEGTLLISLEINPCVFVTSLCSQVCLPSGCAPTQWVLCESYFGACSAALFGVVLLSLLSLTGPDSGLGG